MDFTKVLAGAIFSIGNQRLVLAKALLIPFLLSVATDFLGYLVSGVASSVLTNTLSYVVFTVMSVTTHRVVLLGAESVPEWGIIWPKAREWWFFLYFIMFSLLMMLCAVLVVIPVVGWILMLLLAGWLVARFSLVFPGIATDKNVTFTLSWQLTKDYQILMLLVVVLVPVLLALPFWLISFVPYAYYFSLLLYPVAWVFQVVILSIAYQLITDGSASSSGES